MRQGFFLGLGLMGLWVCAAPAADLRNENLQSVRQVNTQDFFKPATLPSWGRVATEPEALAAVARETLAYMARNPDNPAVTPGIFAELGLSQADVQRSLQLIVDTVAADTRAGRPSRLNDSQWLAQHFRLIRWQPDRAGAAASKVALRQSGQIRLTKYVVFEGQGSPVQTASHCCALYALPDEEASLDAEAAEARKAQLLRYRYTKQQVISGALKGKAVKPLVWLTRQGLEDALMQGSILVRMPDGKQRMFNVHRNNGIAYNKALKDPRQQGRYWYFKEVRGILGYGQDDKIKVEPGVTFAGDVYNLGLGKIIGLRYNLAGQPVFRLGVLADTGGAFVPNLYQLDFLAGVFPSRAAYLEGVKHLPEQAEAFVLIAR